MDMTVLTQERLKELVEYNPETGIFTWRISRRGHAKAGQPFGNPDKDGYLQAKVGGVMSKLHRLAFLYMGVPVPKLVDHENRVRSDNRWRNLRPATTAENSFNKIIRKSSTTGVKGVRFRPEKNLYQAYIGLRGKYKHLGNFKTLDDAAEFVQLAREMIHGEFACHG